MTLHYKVIAACYVAWVEVDSNDRVLGASPVLRLKPGDDFARARLNFAKKGWRLEPSPMTARYLESLPPRPRGRPRKLPTPKRQRREEKQPCPTVSGVTGTI